MVIPLCTGGSDGARLRDLGCDGRLDVKGSSGTIGAPAAIGNAVIDVLYGTSASATSRFRSLRKWYGAL
jgi:hypothetical protein